MLMQASLGLNRAGHETVKRFRVDKTGAKTEVPASTAELSAAAAFVVEYTYNSYKNYAGTGCGSGADAQERQLPQDAQEQDAQEQDAQEQDAKDENEEKIAFIWKGLRSKVTQETLEKVAREFTTGVLCIVVPGLEPAFFTNLFAEKTHGGGDSAGLALPVEQQNERDEFFHVDNHGDETHLPPSRDALSADKLSVLLGGDLFFVWVGKNADQDHADAAVEEYFAMCEGALFRIEQGCEPEIFTARLAYHERGVLHAVPEEEETAREETARRGEVESVITGTLVKGAEEETARREVESVDVAQVATDVEQAQDAEAEVAAGGETQDIGLAADAEKTAEKTVETGTEEVQAATDTPEDVIADEGACISRDEASKEDHAVLAETSTEEPVLVVEPAEDVLDIEAAVVGADVVAEDSETSTDPEHAVVDDISVPSGPGQDVSEEAEETTGEAADEGTQVGDVEDTAQAFETVTTIEEDSENVKAETSVLVQENVSGEDALAEDIKTTSVLVQANVSGEDALAEDVKSDQDALAEHVKTDQDALAEDIKTGSSSTTSEDVDVGSSCIQDSPVENGDESIASTQELQTGVEEVLAHDQDRDQGAQDTTVKQVEEHEADEKTSQEAEQIFEQDDEHEIKRGSTAALTDEAERAALAVATSNDAAEENAVATSNDAAEENAVATSNDAAEENAVATSNDAAEENAVATRNDAAEENASPDDASTESVKAEDAASTESVKAEDAASTEDVETTATLSKDQDHVELGLQTPSVKDHVQANNCSINKAAMSPTALSQETDSTEAGSNADVSDIRSPLNSPSKPAFTVKTMDRMGDEAKTQAKADVKVVPCGKTKLMKAMWEKQRSVDDLGAPSGSSTLTSASGATSMPSSILQAKEALRPPSLEVPGKYADPSVTKYSLELLRGPDRPADVDPTMKERYLSGGDFVETFGLTALQFHNLPEWKRVAFKRQHGLF